MDVCYVVNGVSETSVPATIATALVDRHDVSIDILAWFDASPFQDNHLVSVQCLEAPRSTFGLDPGTYRTAVDAMRGYDLVQLHECHSGAIAKVIGHRLGVPMVSREGNMRRGFTRKGRIANGLTNRLVDTIVCNSQAVYNSFKRWERFAATGVDVEIIPNGVDMRRIDEAASGSWDVRNQFDIPQEAVLVGTASVVDEQKSLATLVRAVRAANERTTERFDLVVAGDGPLRQALEQLAVEENVRDRVHFTGFVNRQEVYQLLHQIDIYAMPSLWEGFSSAAVEALAAGNACVFSDIDAFVIPYRDVALFHPIGDVDRLTERLVELATDPQKRATYVRKGRELVARKYTMERVTDAYAGLYEKLVQRDRARR